MYRENAQLWILWIMWKLKKKGYKLRVGPMASSDRQLPLKVSCGSYGACGSSTNKSFDIKNMYRKNGQLWILWIMWKPNF